MVPVDVSEQERAAVEAAAPAAVGAGSSVRRLAGRLVRDPFAWIVSLWALGGLVWLWAYRRTGYFELDEAAYAGMALRLGAAEDWEAFSHVLSVEGTQGPLQALLAFPPQLLVGTDPRILLIQNVLLAAGTAVLVCWSVRRLSTHVAGTVAGTLVLLAPGVIEQSRLALTATPSMFFSALAVYALVRADGLERGRWTAVAGASVGAMTLARSMTIGFVAVFAVVALGWAWSRRTPLTKVVRGALIMGVAALGTAGWWWIIRWDDVSEYLFGGGSAATERVRDPAGKFLAHANEVATNVGPLVLVVGIGLLVALWPRTVVRSRRATVVDLVCAGLSALAVEAIVSGDAAAGDALRGDVLPWLLAGGVVLALLRAHRAVRRDGSDARAAAEAQDAAAAGAERADGSGEGSGAGPGFGGDGLATWPLAAGMAVGLAVLGSSTAFGVGFVLPIVPWLAVAGVVAARRVLVDRWWRWWAIVVVVAAVPAAVQVPRTGLQAPLTWCAPDEPRAYCEIDSNADGAAWRTVSDRIGDRILRALAAGREAGVEDPKAALTARDATVNGNTVQLSMQWRHEMLIDVWAFLQGGASVEDQIEAVRADADVVVVVPDRYDRVLLAGDSPTPDELIAGLTASGFRPCDRIPTPGGADVVVLVAPAMPDIACEPRP